MKAKEVTIGGYKLAILASASWLAGVAVAHAQTASPPAPTGAGDQIVITGSRVITNGNNAPTPVTVMSLDQLTAIKPDTVFEQLRDLPQFDGSGGASGIPTRGVFAGNNNGDAALNLRGLGAIRALVLFDGYRMPPSSPTGEVDINLMPQMLMQRVDVVTGGASAVYGSDAVSGVINFVVDRKFDGFKFDIQGGESSRSDDRGYKVGAAAGTELFGGRGHVEGSFQINESDGIPSYLRRPSLFDWTLQGDGTAANPYHSVQGVTLSNFTFGGQIQPAFGGPPGPYAGYTFDQNGVLTPRIAGSTAGIATGANEQVGGDGANVTVTSLQAQTSLRQYFGRFDYELTENIHAFANVSVANDHSYAGSMPTLDYYFTLSACNPYLTIQQQTVLGCTNQNDPNQNTFTLNKLPDPRFNALKSTYTTVNQDNYSFIGGFEGSFLKDYNWHTAYTFSETKQYVRNDGIDEDQKLAAALDAVVAPNGQIVCRVTLTNPGMFPGCVPLNVFGPSSESQAAINYSYGSVVRQTTTSLNGVSGDITGAPLHDWAGPVDMALSGEFRHQTLEMTSNTPTAPVDCSFDTILGNCTQGATYTYGNIIAPLPLVSQNTSEAAIEFNVPLLKDAPFVKSLDLNAAGRHTFYQNSGNGVNTTIDANTWKVGLVWDVADQLTIRWARSNDIRAPNLWELFNPVAYTASTPGAIDYLTGNTRAAAAAPQESLGNPYLRPENALTTTIGMVWKPTPSFSLAIDGYFINLKDPITQVTGSNQYNQLACYASGGAAPSCAYQIRAKGSYTTTSTANAVTTWINPLVNIGSLETEGMDIEANYHTDFARHAFSFRGLVSYKPHMIYSEPGLTTIDEAGSAYCNCGVGNLLPNPVWKVQAIANYNIFDDLAVSVSEQWRSAMHLQGDRTKIEVGGVPEFYTTNLNFIYTLPFQNRRYNVYFNIQNLFDKLAPPVGETGGQPGDFGSYALGDDFIGRYFTLGVRGRF